MSDPAPAQTDQQRKIAEMAELAGGLAHELRNPLSTIMINLKLLAEDLADDHAKAGDVRRRARLKVEVLQREAERLQSLFDEFLNLAGPCRLHEKPCDLNALVDGLVGFFEPLAHSQGIGIQVVRRRDSLPCRVDENLLRQALLNLLINAQQAMPDGGVLTITVDGDDGAARITVSDDGVGIAPEDRERILRPFFSTKSRGNGLGLSITQRIIHEHGGTLSFESEVGRGTTFTVTLPLTPGDTDTSTSMADR